MLAYLHPITRDGAEKFSFPHDRLDAACHGLNRYILGSDGDASRPGHAADPVEGQAIGDEAANGFYVSLNKVCRSEKGRDEPVRRMVIEIDRHANLLNAPLIEYRDAVGNRVRVFRSYREEAEMPGKPRNLPHGEVKPGQVVANTANSTVTMQPCRRRRGYRGEPCDRDTH